MSRLGTRLSLIAILTVGFSLVVMPAANAYIDPGTGSMIWSAVVGAFAAIGAGIVVFREKLRTLFTRKPKDPSVGK